MQRPHKTKNSFHTVSLANSKICAADLYSYFDDFELQFMVDETSSEEEFLRRCDGKPLKKVHIALYFRYLESPGSVPLTKTIYLPDVVSSVCTFRLSSLDWLCYR